MRQAFSHDELDFRVGGREGLRGTFRFDPHTLASERQFGAELPYDRGPAYTTTLG